MKHNTDQTEFWFSVFEAMRLAAPLVWPVFALVIVLAIVSKP